MEALILRSNPGLRDKVGHIWVIFIVFSSSKTLKMYTNRYSKLVSALCKQVQIYVVYCIYIRIYAGASHSQLSMAGILNVQ
jgi:hypothetical protein